VADRDTVGDVRWEALFADLDAQLDAATAAELADEVSDRSRREVARLHLADRAGLAPGANLSAGVAGAGTVAGRLVRSGPGWWLLAASGAELLVCTDAIAWVAGLPALAADPEATPAVQRRLGLGYALRGIAKDRSSVTIVLRDGTGITGTLDRVGADFADVAEHAPGEARRAGSVRGARTVPFAAIAVIRSS
jgi:hypothetical protein